MPTIALIDDDPDIVEANRLLLEANGYYVVSAGTVDEAIDLIREEHPDLVILDVMMQEADDGFYLANRFRRSGYDFPIIMLTCLSRSIGMHLGESALVPIDDFLEKPVPPSQLLDAIDTQLRAPRRGT
ncbi:MAG: response regulator [Bacteroidetes bacterium]|nr:response regulator [Bacteroidota bacterium]